MDVCSESKWVDIRTNKLRSSLTYLLKALEIEYKNLNFSESAVDEQLITSNPCDTHLNICAILSQMDKHDLALQHSMKALILIQDEIIGRVSAEGSSKEDAGRRFMVLSVAYHNIGVEYEFLKEYQQSLNAYRKAIENAEKNLSGSGEMVDNLKNVYYQALEKIGDTVKKTVQ